MGHNGGQTGHPETLVSWAGLGDPGTTVGSGWGRRPAHKLLCAALLQVFLSLQPVECAGLLGCNHRNFVSLSLAQWEQPLPASAGTVR